MKSLAGAALLVLLLPGCENQPDVAAKTELEVTLEQLVRGEHEAALADGETWFSPETAHILRSAQVDSAGHAIIDFVDLRPVIGNASSSAGSRILLDDLNAAVFGIPQIQSVEYRMEGSCDLFGDWLQYGCLRITRADYNRPGESARTPN